MINRFITWLRRDDQALEPLRKQIEQQERQMDWELLQRWIIYILFAASIVGLAFMFTMLWTSA